MRNLFISTSTLLLSPMFDPSTFMDQTVNDVLATDYTLVPEREFRAMIDDFGQDAFETITFDSKTNPGEKDSMHKFNAPCVILDDAVKAALGRDKIVVRAQMILDFDADGNLASGPNKNVKLGQLREALGQNQAPWAFSRLKGAGPLMVKVQHRNIAKKGEEPRYMAEVTRFGKIS